MPTIYEKRTYSVTVGQMSEVVRLYSTQGWPALEAGGFAKNCIGYFISDTGELHQLVHLWLIKTQVNQLMLAAPWGPHP